MARNVKKGDTVEIIAGEDKGTTGRVIRVIASSNRVVVEGRNRTHKHVRPSRKHPQGGRILVEQPIDISNVLPVSSKSSKGVRVRYQIDKKGAKKRVGVDGSDLGTVKR